MRSQSAVKKGGYKAMGSSALKTLGHGLKPDYPDHPHSHRHSEQSSVEWKRHAKNEKKKKGDAIMTHGTPSEKAKWKEQNPYWK